jgi:hypothetical protein
MDIDDLMTKSNDYYRFHGVRRATLERLVAQGEGDQLRLWGTDHDEHIDNQDGEFEVEYVRGAGYLYTTDISDLEMSASEFAGDDGLVLVLEKIIDTPFEFEHPSDRRQCIVRAEEWRVVGGLRPVFDEDGDLIDQEALSLDEIREEYE